jgi:hypothetical protein
VDQTFTDDSLTRALNSRESSFERPHLIIFFFLTKAPMIRVTTKITQPQPGKTVNPNFLDAAGLFLDKGNQPQDAALQLPRGAIR